MPGTRAGIFVDSFLHEECRLPVDEIRQRGSIADRRAPAEQIEKSHDPSASGLPIGSFPGGVRPVETTPYHRSNFKG